MPPHIVVLRMHLGCITRTLRDTSWIIQLYRSNIFEMLYLVTIWILTVPQGGLGRLPPVKYFRCHGQIQRFGTIRFGGNTVTMRHRMHFLSAQV